MLLQFALSFIAIAIAAFMVQRTARTAEKPRKWRRNGLLGIATISMASMALLVARQSMVAFAIFAAWLPAMFVGILIERWQYGSGKSD